MQAVLLAAGNSSRMYPFSSNGHKSMIHLLGKPIIEHVIEKLKAKDIKDIIIVVSENSEIIEYFGNGEKFGVNIQFVIQNSAKGGGNALLLCKDLLEEDFFLLNSYRDDIDKYIDDLLSKKSGNDGVLLLSEREKTWLYGVVKTENEKVVGVVEKPEKGSEPSKLCIVGVYLLSANFIDVLEQTPEEHYQFEKALDIFSKSHNLSFVQVDEEKIALKYPWDLLKVKDYFLSGIESHQGENVKIGENVTIEGPVYIEDDVEIMDGATIKGPCYLGKNSYVGTSSILRGGVDLGENAKIGALCEVKNSVIMTGATTHSGFIGDSVIGSNVKIAANITTTNVRLDRENVKSEVKGEKVDTGLRDLGMIVGNNAQIGGSVTVMPGIIIGEKSIIGPSTTVVKNVEKNVKYYTEFKEIIVKNNE